MRNILYALSALILYSLFPMDPLRGEERSFAEIRKFEVPEARQGVAVDSGSLYAIDTREIARYDKRTGKLLQRWKQKEKEGRIIHLDSGVVFDGKIYCAHSNYPALPMTSSIEIWDAATLEHIGTHSFGINWGSCTWIDRHQGCWWAVFAHYNQWKQETGTDVRWTSLVKFDDRWQMQESWIFPKEVLDRFGTMSNSGGSWGPDSHLYCTGHDAAEIYVLKLPKAGSLLELVETVSVNNTGQGLAWDRSDPFSVYTIRRDTRQIVHSRMHRKEN